MSALAFAAMSLNRRADAEYATTLSTGDEVLTDVPPQNAAVCPTPLSFTGINNEIVPSVSRNGGISNR